jgi:signal transduction histidine kinase
MRSFARSGEQDPFQPTCLKDIFEDVMQLCEKTFSQRDIKLKAPHLDPSLVIECRESQISQVLLNLLNNASDAINKGSDKWIQIEVTPRDKEIEISITDSGTEISPEVRKRLFQPFFTTKEVGKGTGLGLSISKKIVESHRGTLKLDLDSSKTRFVVTLPRTQSF